MADNKLTLHEKLVDIQNRLAVPKGQHNAFGNYDYRNIEDIEAAVKPLLHEHGLTLTFGDSIEQIGERTYVRAEAVLRDDASGSMTCSGYAREADTKKGMDDAQITGAASSYARKYAAGGLFLLDNGKDADSMDNTAQKRATKPTSTVNTRPASPKSVEWMRDVAEKYAPAEMGVDGWIKSVLTMGPEQVPQYKVKDAVDKLQATGKLMTGKAQQQVDDVVIEPTDEPINLDDIPY
jgi:hypothetical protein